MGAGEKTEQTSPGWSESI